MSERINIDTHYPHKAARTRFDGLSDEMLVFCRQTQLGFFRLLTNAAVMGNETVTQHQCWAIYEEWLVGGRAILQDEPPGVEAVFRARTLASEPAPKTRMDAYLAAFTEAAGLTLVAFDRALAAKVKGAVVLG